MCRSESRGFFDFSVRQRQVSRGKAAEEQDLSLSRRISGTVDCTIGGSELIRCVDRSIDELIQIWTEDGLISMSESVY